METKNYNEGRAMSEHEARQALQGATISDVIAIYAPGEDDELILVLPTGAAVSITADRLRLKLIDDFEGELAAIRVEHS